MSLKMKEKPQESFARNAANSPMPVIDKPKKDIKILDANYEIKMAKNPLVIITKDFLKEYGYAALGWFSNGIPFTFESQEVRDIVPSNYGRWVDEPVNGYSKIFDPSQCRLADKIIIVGQPKDDICRFIEKDNDAKSKQIRLCDITSNMRAFNFEPLRPEDANDVAQTMNADPRSRMDLCRSISRGSEVKKPNSGLGSRNLCV